MSVPAEEGGGVCVCVEGRVSIATVWTQVFKNVIKKHLLCSLCLYHSKHVVVVVVGGGAHGGIVVRALALQREIDACFFPMFLHIWTRVVHW